MTIENVACPTTEETALLFTDPKGTLRPIERLFLLWQKDPKSWGLIVLVLARLT
jgi:hypothetical protein